MDWKGVGNAVIKAGAPLLGGALFGPAGAALMAQRQPRRLLSGCTKESPSVEGLNYLRTCRLGMGHQLQADSTKSIPSLPRPFCW